MSSATTTGNSLRTPIMRANPDADRRRSCFL